MRNLCEHGGAEHLPACRVDGAKRGGVNSHLVARIDLHRPSSASRSPHGREQTIHCMRLTVLAAAISSLSWLLHVHAAPAAEPVECGQWAAAGECTANPSYMQSHCARACASAPTTTADRYSEPEQCAGWASNGECTRNPKYMLDTCPRNCAEQRAPVVAGFLDEASRCIDEATKEKCTTAGFRKQCAGSCKVLALCEDEADPPECRRALRCASSRTTRRSARRRRRLRAAGWARAAPATSSATATSRAPSTTSPASSAASAPRSRCARARTASWTRSRRRRASRRGASSRCCRCRAGRDAAGPAAARNVHQPARGARPPLAPPRRRVVRGAAAVGASDGGQERLPLGRRAARPFGRRRRSRCRGWGGAAACRCRRRWRRRGGRAATRCASSRL